MVCSWGLVKAYQQTQQNVYICPPAPHIIEAYNHKVNHDTHKELNLQECTLLQYAHALQYVSFCNDTRYKDHWAPAVKAFWVEVVEPFGSRVLHDLDPSHLLGNAMCPNWRAKIPDYGVQDHIAYICAPFFQGIESRSQYENRRCWWEEDYRHAQMALGDHRSSSCGPKRRTWSRESENPRQWNQVSPKVSPGGGGVRKNGGAIVEEKGHPEPWEVGLPMTHQAPRIRSYLLPLSHHGIKQWKDPRPSRWPSKRPWSSAILPPWPGKTRCRRRKNGRGVAPLWKAAPAQAHLPHYWRVITLAMSPWSMTVSSNVTLTWSSRRRGKREWKQTYHMTLLPPHLWRRSPCQKTSRPGTPITTVVTRQKRVLTKTCPMTPIPMKMIFWGW